MGALTQPVRFRHVLLVVAVLVIIGLGGYVAYQRWATIQNYFDEDREDAAALAELAKAEVKPVAAADAATGWPQWRGPNRDGLAPAGPLRTNWKEKPPAKVWSVPCGGGYASFAVVGGKVYTQDRDGNDERVLCLDAVTGSTVWTFPYPVNYAGMAYGYGPRATPTVHEGRVYTVGATGIFLCLDVTGPQPKELWRHDLLAEFNASLPQWGVACSPLIEGHVIIVQPGGRDGSVVGFDRLTGERRWATGKNPSGYSSPVAATLAGIRHVVAVTGDAVLGLRPSDGKELWSYPWITEHKGNIATPVIVGDNVFVSSNYNKGCALLSVSADGYSAKVKEVYFRKNRVMQNHHSTSVARGAFVYGYDGNTLRCVDWKKGAVKDDWDGTGERAPNEKGSVILADKYLIGLTESGTLFLGEANPDGFVFHGEVKGVLSGRECWALPVLADGRIYVRDASKVVCLDVR